MSERVPVLQTPLVFWVLIIIYGALFVPYLISGTAQLIVFAAPALILLWLLWYFELICGSPFELLRGSKLPTRNWQRALVCRAPAVSLMLMAILLTATGEIPTLSASQMGHHFILWTFWITVASQVLPLYGIFPREDVAERRNDAAAQLIPGVILAFTICVALAGSRLFLLGLEKEPLWSVDIACLLLFCFWAVFQRMANVAEAITVERDTATAWRTSALLSAAALLLGQGATALLLREWPAAAVLLGGTALLLAFAWIVELVSQRRVRRHGTGGMMPALAYVLGACLVSWLGARV
jgi:hypothetical protein